MNITYLLGAGASFEALPIVDQIPNKLQAFANAFRINNFEFTVLNEQKSNIAEKHLFRFSSKEDQKREYEKIRKFHEDILWLEQESKKHTSIDTFAKKLYLQGNTDLKKLKYILSCFFIYEQTFYFDKRYDSFFASILESLSEIPNNLKILSWNYDSQLEIAFSNFSNTTVEKSRENLNIISKGNNISSDKKNNNFSIFKINGTTSIKDSNNKTYDLIENYHIDKVSLVSKFLEAYKSTGLFSTIIPNMSFAWEDFGKELKFYSDLRDSVKNTDILIVIGYSFPFFNRKIDKFILDSMDDLTKIHVQDPDNAESIIQKINGLMPVSKRISTNQKINQITYESKTFTDQFFIPIEF